MGIYSKKIGFPQYSNLSQFPQQQPSLRSGLEDSVSSDHPLRPQSRADDDVCFRKCNVCRISTNDTTFNVFAINISRLHVIVIIW